jgi:hypothetical protein
VTVPPAAFFALIKQGSKAAQSFKVIEAALEKMKALSRLSKKTLRTSTYRTHKMNSIFKGEQFGYIFESSVKYLSETERMKLKVQFKDGKWLDVNGVPLNAKKAIYVMDSNGNIFFKSNPIVGVFQHSSFFAGKPVAAAGEISVQNGIATLINRKSKHYLPSEEMLEQFLTQVKSQGVEIEKIQIGGFE